MAHRVVNVVGASLVADEQVPGRYVDHEVIVGAGR